MRTGSEMLQDVPIRSNQELWNRTKEYYLQQHDTDIGALITPYNWDSTDLTFNESSYKTTDAQHINIALNINGRNSGWNCSSHQLVLDIDSGVNADEVYLDQYAICSMVQLNPMVRL